MRTSLENKNVAIYGGGRAVGGTVARTFARTFARGEAGVPLAGCTKETLATVAAEVTSANSSAGRAEVEASDEGVGVLVADAPGLPRFDQRRLL